MRSKKSSHTDDVSSWLGKPVHKFTSCVFAGLSIFWTICAVIEGLGVLHAFNINWMDVFPGRSHSVTVSVFGFAFSLVLGFWVYSFSAQPTRRDATYGFVGLIVSALLWCQLTQDFPSSANEVDPSWLWLSIVFTCVFTLLARRLYAKRMLLLIALCLAAPIGAEVFLGGDDWNVALYVSAYWLNSEGAWSPLPVIFFVMFPICLLAWRADQIEFGYKFKRRALAWVSMKASLSHTIFRPVNSQNLYWRKQSFVFLVVLIGLIGDRLELEHIGFLFILLGGLSLPLLLARILEFQGFSRRENHKKACYALVYLMLPVVLLGAIISEALFFVFAFASFSAALQFQHKGSVPTRSGDFSYSLTAYVCSVVYNAVFLLFIALLAWILGMLVPSLWGYHGLLDLWGFEAIIVSSLIAIATVGLLGKLRGSFEQSHSDAVLAGFLVFLYFFFVEGRSPGMSGGLAVTAMLVGTLFGAMAIELLDRRKGFGLVLLNGGREIYSWAIGCPTVLIPLSVIGIMVSALYGIRFFTINYLL
ncbi:hypothetical protein [Thalassospira australica]|uniref:hypothetical protein n=1 Tax=Thalassospira australica TaxID=1528106 RepID=UPI000AE18B75|nr:hypothetical protein [Thalassospira australica]